MQSEALSYIVLQVGYSGFKVYLVGGCVRDLLIKRAPKDWGIATDAKPEEIQKIFPESVYEKETLRALFVCFVEIERVAFVDESGP